MKFTDAIHIPEAIVKEVKTKPWEKKKNRVELTGRLTPDAALTLGLNVFNSSGIIRSGWSYLEESAAGCAAARVLLNIEGLRSIELTVDEVSEVWAQRSGDVVTVGMRASFSGSVLELVGWLEEVGKKVGTCAIDPLQQELAATAGVEATLTIRDKATGETESIPVPRDTLRRAVLGNRKVQ